jgi:GNAT superfamily N-acetyltransferase
VFLGVSPDRQGRGLGSYLLADQLAVLQNAGTPAYLEANDRRSRRLYLRYGFLDHGRTVTTEGSPPIYPMWRPLTNPAPARSASGHRTAVH